MASLKDLPTPSLVLDRAVLVRNIDAMSARAKRAGVDLRPHMKTAKCAEIARLATSGHSGGICVSTVQEAEYFVGEGFRDVTYAFGVVPSKLERLAALVRRGATIRLLLDNPAAAVATAEKAASLATTFPVLVEIDTGHHRAGLAPDSPDLVETARRVHEAPSLELAGVLTHGGHSYDCRSAGECRRAADQERDGIVRAARRLREAGLPCPAVAPGSTPTAVHGTDWTGATELRPGNYMFFDLHQHGIGACAPEEIAVSVLSSVVGHNRAAGHILIDAGGLALSKDASAQDQLPAAGYGWVMSADGRERIGDLAVGRLSQEHGVVTSPSGRIPFDRLPVGATVRVLPGHSCMTAAAYERYHLVEDGGTELVGEWRRVNGW